MTNELNSSLQSESCQSNTGYHQTGKMNWWARLTSGGSRVAEFLDIPYVRGDRPLDVIVDVPPGTKVFIGAGAQTEQPCPAEPGESNSKLETPNASDHDC